MADFYGGNDLIYEYNEGTIMAGGYKITSSNLTDILKGGGSIDEPINENYIIPIGLINFNKTNKNIFNILNNSNILSHDIYDHLLNLVNINPKLFTKKNKSFNKSKTRKNNKKLIDSN